MRVGPTISAWFAALFLLAGGTTALHAHGTGEKDGPEFESLTLPQPIDVQGKIEVIEFFWYGCPHCATIEHGLEAWAARLPKDVVLRREHVLWDGRRGMAEHVRIFATLRALDLLGTQHAAVFEAIHKGKLDLADEKKLFEWVSKRGVDRGKFDSTYRSFSVLSQVDRARQLTKRYRVDGVPMFVVNGKYVTSIAMAHGPERMFEVIEQLIAKERTLARRTP